MMIVKRQNEKKKKTWWLGKKLKVQNWMKKEQKKKTV
jgi:hypothetical protein